MRSAAISSATLFGPLNPTLRMDAHFGLLLQTLHGEVQRKDIISFLKLLLEDKKPIARKKLLRWAYRHLQKNPAHLKAAIIRASRLALTHAPDQTYQKNIDQAVSILAQSYARTLRRSIRTQEARLQRIQTSLKT